MPEPSSQQGQGRVERIDVVRAWMLVVSVFLLGVGLRSTLPEAWESDYLGGVCIGISIALQWRAFDLMDRR